MKTKTYPISVFIVLVLLFSFQSAHSQIDVNKLKNKAKEKANSINTNSNSSKETKEVAPEPKTESVKESTETSSEGKPASVVQTKNLAAGKGHFYTAFKQADSKPEVNIGEELFVRFVFSKTMMEYSADFGIDETFNAYGFFTYYIDGKQVDVAGPFHFSSNYSKAWTEIDIPLAIAPTFLEKVQADQSMLETGQDVWLFQQLFNETGTVNKYTVAAIKGMPVGKHQFKIEFGLGEKNGTAAIGTICAGEVTVISDEKGRQELYKKGPKNLRPLDDAEKGQFVAGNTSFKVGNGSLECTLKLPNPPKYYDTKWCRSMSCDYDHGSMGFYAEIDGEVLAAWTTKFWDDNYMVNKEFKAILIPASDQGIDDIASSFNTTPFFKDENVLVYALLDKIYSGNLKDGKHDLKLKFYSLESGDLNTPIEQIGGLPAIAESTISFTIDAAGRSALMNASVFKMPGHAGGEWASVDAHLKATTSNEFDDVKIIDIATQTQWEVTKNSLGVILYRTCKADVVYSSKFGYRLSKSNLVKEDHNGSAYGKPYFTSSFDPHASPSMLNTMHRPVPPGKAK